MIIIEYTKSNLIIILLQVTLGKMSIRKDDHLEKVTENTLSFHDMLTFQGLKTLNSKFLTKAQFIEFRQFNL